LATLYGIDLVEDEYGWLVSGWVSWERQLEAFMGNCVQSWSGHAEPLGFFNPVTLG
jgi:hypothetical protein